MNKTILAILALCLTAGCSTGKIITTVNSMPGAVEKLKTKTIEVRAVPDSDMMTRKAADSVKSVMLDQGMKWVPNGGQIIMDVSMGYQGRGIAKSTTVPSFTGWGVDQTYHEQMDVFGLTLAASENGQPIWEGRITGSAEFLTGDVQGGCIRELLQQRIDDNGSSEQRCYKSAYR